MDPAPGIDEELTPPAPGRGRLIGAILAGIGIVALLGLLTVGLLNQDRATTIDDALEEGERPDAPALSLPLLVPGGGLGREGETVSLDDLRGRPVVLNFWASWCPPCRDEAPLLEDLWRRYRDRGVVMLGVDVRDLSGNARDFAEEFGYTYPSVRDGTDETERRFQTTGVPETFIIDRQGRIALHLRGPVTSEEQVSTALDQIL